MTGPEHYLTAEALLGAAGQTLQLHAGLPFQERVQRYRADIALAQVHATLAVAAATALNDHSHGDDSGLPWRDVDRWQRTAGEKPPQPDPEELGPWVQQVATPAPSAADSREEL